MEQLLKKAKKFVFASKGKLVKKEEEVEKLNNELRSFTGTSLRAFFFNLLNIAKNKMRLQPIYIIELKKNFQKFILKFELKISSTDHLTKITPKMTF